MDAQLAEVGAKRLQRVPGRDSGGCWAAVIMESGGGAYGAAKAGGTFDLWRFLQQPQVVVRILSAVSEELRTAAGEGGETGSSLSLLPSAGRAGASAALMLGAEARANWLGRLRCCRDNR